MHRKHNHLYTDTCKACIKKAKGPQREEKAQTTRATSSRSEKTRSNREHLFFSFFSVLFTDAHLFRPNVHIYARDICYKMCCRCTFLCTVFLLLLSCKFVVAVVVFFLFLLNRIEFQMISSHAIVRANVCSKAKTTTKAEQYPLEMQVNKRQYASFLCMHVIQSLHLARSPSIISVLRFHCFAIFLLNIPYFAKINKKFFFYATRTAHSRREDIGCLTVFFSSCCSTSANRIVLFLISLR